MKNVINVSRLRNVFIKVEAAISCPHTSLIVMKRYFNLTIKDEATIKNNVFVKIHSSFHVRHQQGLIPGSKRSEKT